MDKPRVSNHLVDYYSAVKKNTLLIHATLWMNLKIMTLKEARNTYYRILFLYSSRKPK